MSVKPPPQYVRGEVVVFQNWDVTGSPVLGVFRVLKSFDFQDILDKSAAYFKKPMQEKDFLQLMVKRGYLDPITSQVVYMDTSAYGIAGEGGPENLCRPVETTDGTVDHSNSPMAQTSGDRDRVDRHDREESAP